MIFGAVAWKLHQLTCQDKHLIHFTVHQQYNLLTRLEKLDYGKDIIHNI